MPTDALPPGPTFFQPLAGSVKDVARATTVPLFRRDRRAYSLFYAPGYLVVTARAAADDFARHLLARTTSGTSSPVSAGSEEERLAEALLQQAQRARREEEAAARRPFAPVSLTLNLNNHCQLRCRYCYAYPTPSGGPRLEPEQVRPALALVLENCRRRQLPLTLHCEGGAEPSANPRRLQALLKLVEEECAAAGVPLFRSLDSNGVLPATQVRWLATHFDLIGLSCDGPGGIQAQQRPLRNGLSSTPFVERTSAILREMGAPFTVRVTITRETVARQKEIARYLCEQLQPYAIYVEPIYHGGRARAADCLRPDEVAPFISNFLQARALAHAHGVPWRSSAVRPGEFHGRYCHLLHDVLTLTPAGMVIACFRVGGANGERQAQTSLGQVEGSGPARQLRLDQERIAALTEAVNRRPPACDHCFNRYHCTLACPDYCPLRADAEEGAPASAIRFRCLMQQHLATAILEERAAALWATGAPLSGGSLPRL